MKGYVCIHGHFYQPPRENPWLERIEVQDSASPYHDWNARVHAECYAPNAVSRILNGDGRIVGIVNNYENISFNFGPTLLGWMEHASPDIYRKIIQADRISLEKRGGHGNAIAQAYNHLIMPLANRRDKITQIVWGIRSFRRHFGRDPEGMWLPETAVDVETLEILHEQGLRFTILAPRQARRVRALGAINWREVSEGSIDPTMPYQVRLPCGGEMAVFFYNGGIAHEIAFGGLLHSAEALEKRLLEALPNGQTNPPLVNVATDGETYGHHHRFSDMALACALDQLKKNPEVGLTNYGEYLSRFAPTHEVEIVENSSWSCVHGIERWRNDCGCRAGGNPDWNQKWRQTLRQSLDWLRYELIRLYTAQSAQFLRNPWEARDDYIEVIMSRSEEAKKDFLARQAIRPLSKAERSLVFQLLEIQRNAMLMYTSCGWFFDEISGLEAVQVLRYAARALDLAGRFLEKPLEPEFTERLHEAQSNIDGMGSGADVYRKFALGARAHLREVAIHFAISSFFEDYQKKNTLGCYAIELREYERLHHENTVAAVGLLHTGSVVTEEEASFIFAALQQELHDYYCAVTAGPAPEVGKSGHAKPADFKKTYAELAGTLRARLNDQGPSGALKVIDQYLGRERYTIKDLFKDEQEELLDIILERELQQVGKTFEEIYRKTSFLTALLEHYGHRIPSSLTNAAEVALKRKMVQALEDKKSTPETMRQLLDEIKRWQITLDREWFAGTISARLAREMEILKEQQGIANLKQMNALLAMLSLVPVQLNLWQVQNSFFELLRSDYPLKKKEVDNGDVEARKWVDEFMRLGDGLNIHVERLVAQPPDASR